MSGQETVLELFAGIGGMACAWPEAADVVAVDINRSAAELYRSNFPHLYVISGLDGGGAHNRLLGDLWHRSTWWMSPPCQPFTHRGKRRDVDDPRSAALQTCIDAIERCRPRWIAMENVAAFRNSKACRRLIETLERSRYHYQTLDLCATELGWPNRRPRFYLVAGLDRPRAWRRRPFYRISLEAFLETDEAVHPDLWIDEATTKRYHSAIDRVMPGDPRQSTACFTASYGKYVVHSGSYLQIECKGGGWRLRRFSPREVARLLGFPDTYRFDAQNRRAMWKMLGNSLSLPAARYILSHLPHGPNPELPWWSRD
ncbi:MAG: hypothetical protein D6753_04170 [Planctomycetota bacterium]|nr:MAG: hypothetical protein D6753_04170 [Planctomycetota bacterium]